MSTSMKPAAAIFILVVMVLSVAGFAMNSANMHQQPEQIKIPSVIREPISTEYQINILRSGRVLIEHFYQSNCTECMERNAKLEEFVSRLEGFAVLNEVAGNESRLDMIGMGGKIVDIHGSELDYDTLMDTFCEIAIAQPRECLIREV